MKIKLLFVAFLFAACIKTAASQTNTFERLSNNKNITSVVVSKAMLSMMPSDMQAGVINIKDFTDKLDNVEIYSAQNSSAISVLKSEADIIAKDPKYKTLMNLKDGERNITFFAQPNKDYFQSLVMVVLDQSGQSVIVRIQGAFTSEDIQNIVNSSNKKR